MNSQVRAGQHQLRPRISIDVGKIHCCKLGGLYNRWHFVIVGPVLERLGDAYRKAQVGDVVLCRELYRSIQGHCEGTNSNELFTLDDVFEAVPIRQNNGFRARLLFATESLSRMRRLSPPSGKKNGWQNFETSPFADVSRRTSRSSILSLKRFKLRSGKFNVLRADLTVKFTRSSWMIKDSAYRLPLVFPDQAHEDDPQRGVEAALAISNELKSQACGFDRHCIGQAVRAETMAAASGVNIVLWDLQSTWRHA